MYLYVMCICNFGVNKSETSRHVVLGKACFVFTALYSFLPHSLLLYWLPVVFLFFLRVSVNCCSLIAVPIKEQFPA